MLWFDPSWLIIGHVDEPVSQVPSKVGHPYRRRRPLRHKYDAETAGEVVIGKGQRAGIRADPDPGVEPAMSPVSSSSPSSPR